MMLMVLLPSSLDFTPPFSGLDCRGNNDNDNSDDEEDGGVAPILIIWLVFLSPTYEWIALVLGRGLLVQLSPPPPPPKLLE